jgi:alpha-acetolactate decarboxylase
MPYAEPIIGIVDGLLEGDHSVAEVLRKGNLGLGTLNGLDGEVSGRFTCYYLFHIVMTMA